MPFTFARWLDPRLQFPAVQHTIMAAMRTVVLVPRDKDASEGDMWYATKDLKLITWRHQARDMVYLRRFDLRADSKNRLGVMWIGAQLNGKDYRITCNLLDDVGRAKLWLNLKAAEVGDGPDLMGADACAYRARSIRVSAWAGRAPHAAVGSDGDNYAPPASMGVTPARWTSCRPPGNSISTRRWRTGTRTRSIPTDEWPAHPARPTGIRAGAVRARPAGSPRSAPRDE